MSTYYSMWEMGKSIDTNRIVSMTPVSPNVLNPENLSSLPLAAGSLAVSAVAQFGQYLEARKANELRAAEFEERRHDWLNGIMEKWVDEHRYQPGIIRDVTEALATECEKLLEQVIENPKVDVPQLLLLQVSRISQFLEENYRLMARATNRLVEESGSSEDWLWDADLDFNDYANGLIDDDSENEKNLAKKWVKAGALGIPLAFVPVMGPVLAGGAAGGMLGGLSDLMKTPKIERAREFLPLLKLPTSAVLCELVASELECLLEHQPWKQGTQLTVTDAIGHAPELLLPKVKTGTWPFSKMKPLTMTPVEYPSEEANQDHTAAT